MEINRCMKCMREYRIGESVCPQCGNVHGHEKQPPFALHCGTILKYKYLIGMAIGQGGFGLTYVGYDLSLNMKVAIKEYYPSSMASRNTQNGTVQWHSTAAYYKQGCDNFLKEARKMAKLDDIPGVVRVRDMMQENNTAYIVMDFVEGTTLKAKLQREGVMSYSAAVTLLTPIINALSQVHKLGIIHRDISPDNLMISPNRTVYLLDLGAAKEIDLRSDSDKQSSSLIHKDGFSPPEQYMTGGAIGPWTDVYAMCATIYYCCTGQRIPNVMDRYGNAQINYPASMNQGERSVLSKGLSLHAEDRFRNMSELSAALRGKIEIGGENLHAILNISLEEAVSGCSKVLELNSKKITVSIPAGINDGESVRIPHLGEQGQNGGPRGDLLVKILVAPHAFFHRENQNLFSAVSITHAQAEKGGEIRIPAIDGEISFKVKAGTQSGTQIRLPGRGVPSVHNPNIRGDQYVTLMIENREPSKTGSKTGKKKIVITAATLAVIAGIAIGATAAINSQNNNANASGTEESSNAEKVKTTVETSAETETPVPTETATPTPTTEATPTPTEEPQCVFGDIPKIGDIVQFGSYEQDNNTENGAEPIDWIVREKEDGKALLVSQYGLDAKPFCDKFWKVTSWKECGLRTWLNDKDNGFFGSAFNSDEQEFICNTEVITEDNQKYETGGGGTTADKIFLLSIDEFETYFEGNDYSEAEATEYAKANGVAVNDSTQSCGWWLRSPGMTKSMLAVVNDYGNLNDAGTTNDDSTYAIRPAMWVNIDQ